MTEQEREELIVKMANAMFASKQYNGCFTLTDMACAALAVAEPVIREQCAKIAEGELLHFPKLTKAGKGYNQACNEVAVAIREGKHD